MKKSIIAAKSIYNIQVINKASCKHV